jgi:hypothetical protein
MPKEAHRHFDSPTGKISFLSSCYMKANGRNNHLKKISTEAILRNICNLSHKAMEYKSATQRKPNSITKDRSKKYLLTNCHSILFAVA